MAAFTITLTKNIDELTGKTGGDTFSVNGGTLIIDQHSRFGLNNNNSAATTATSMGSITLSATLGGTCTIDGRNVRLIQFTGGSGTIPALNSLVTQGSASGKLMCVYSSLTAAPLVNGGTMPANGWIMIKQWNGIEYSAGALTLSGVTATSSGVSRVGFIEIFGDEASTVKANRLGTFNVYGEWYEVGVTSGVSNQTMQIPNHGTLKHFGGVYIEKTVGGNDFEFYPNAGTVTTTGTDSFRGKVVWIDKTGLVRIGNSGAATNGYTPIAGLRVVIGNVWLQNCLAKARNAEVIPNATVATRYDFTSTGGGVINMDKVMSAWYLSFSQPYSVQLTNVATIDALLLTECATPINWSKVGVGNKPTTALTTAALTLTYCYAGGTLTDCVWNRTAQAASGAHSVVMNDIVGFTFLRNTVRAGTIRGHATTYSISVTRATNCAWTEPNIIQGNIYLATCNGITITDTKYADVVSGDTITTYAMYVWNLTANTLNVTISGLSFPVANTHPYTALFTASAGCANINVRNIGTFASPLNMGSANACANVYTVGTNCQNFKFQRIYVINTRSVSRVGDNSCKNFLEENLNSDYGDTPLSAILNLSRRNCICTNAVTAQTSIYGTHWSDFHTSTTAGRLQIMMNEPTTETASQVTLANGAAFTSAGGLYMPTIGHSATFEMPYYAIGHLSFQNSALVMGGGTVGNYRFEYSIDKNDGNGYSAMTSASYTAATLATALNGLTGIDATKGFKLKLKITTTTTNATAITSVYLLTTSNTTTQAYQYPLDVIYKNVSITNLVTGTEIHIYRTSDLLELAGTESSGTSFTWEYLADDTNVFITMIKPGYKWIRYNDIILSASGVSIIATQQADLGYNNPT